MKTERILLSSIAATGVMTAFSYLTSAIRKENYREPELLAAILKHLFRKPGDLQGPYLCGWLLHFLAGAGWSPVQFTLLRLRAAKANPAEAALFGIVGGIAGSLIWHKAFKLAGNKPKINKEAFYVQLVPAHVIYSLSLWALIKNDIKRPTDQKPILSLPQNLSKDTL